MQRQRIWGLVVLLIIFVLALTACGGDDEDKGCDDGVDFCGKITDGGGKAVEGASVKIFIPLEGDEEADLDNYIAMATTDADGKYAISESLASGTYKVTVDWSENAPTCPDMTGLNSFKKVGKFLVMYAQTDTNQGALFAQTTDNDISFKAGEGQRLNLKFPCK